MLHTWPSDNLNKSVLRQFETFAALGREQQSVGAMEHCSTKMVQHTYKSGSSPEISIFTYIYIHDTPQDMTQDLTHDLPKRLSIIHISDENLVVNCRSEMPRLEVVNAVEICNVDTPAKERRT